MKQLEILEKKIAQVIQKTKDLQVENDVLRQKAAELLKQNEQLQEALLKEQTTMSLLSTEKASMKGAIEELLSSIAVLETTDS